MRLRELAPAKLNLALHVRGKRGDGRHDLETLFAFCIEGDWIEVETSDQDSFTAIGPMAGDLGNQPNIVTRAVALLGERRGRDSLDGSVRIILDKRLPVASGIGGGSADAAATLRALTALWRLDPSHAAQVAPLLGSDVPACLLSMTMRGTGAGDALMLVDEPAISGTRVLLVNPGVPLTTAEVFAGWDGIDRGPLGDWREGRNDLESPARQLVPEIGEVLAWLGGRPGAHFARMSGSGATCFALFDDELSLLSAAAACPEEWWHLATFLR